MSTTTATATPLGNPVALKTADPYTLEHARLSQETESSMLASAGILLVIGLFLLLFDLRARRRRRDRNAP